MIESKKKFKLIDIIYKPTKHPEIEPICYYANNIAKAYTNFYSVKNKNKRATNVQTYKQLLVVTNVTTAEKTKKVYGKLLRSTRSNL